MNARLLAAGAAIAAVLASAATAAVSADVTLRVDRFYDAGNFIWRLRFAGAISAPTPNQYVAVLGHTCGKPASTAISVAGDTTRADGSWGPVVPGTGGLPDVAIPPPATYRARWNGRFSESVTIRVPRTHWLAKLPGRRYRISVSGSEMRGRIVELQRLASGRWTLVRKARLARDRQGTFSATFAVRTRGLTMRILIPQQSTGPCYLETPTKTWRS